MILARRHDSTALEVLSGPALGFIEQKELFKQFKETREHRDFAEVQLWESGSGCTSRVKLRPTEEEPAIVLPDGPSVISMIGLTGELSAAQEKSVKLELELTAARGRIAELERAAKKKVEGRGAKVEGAEEPQAPAVAAPAPVMADDGPAFDLLQRANGGTSTKDTES